MGIKSYKIRLKYVKALYYQKEYKSYKILRYILFHKVFYVLRKSKGVIMIMKRSNHMMDKFINEILYHDCNDSLISIENICLLLWPEFKEVNGCILLNLLENGVPNKINIDKVIEIYGDFTAYECSYNEIRLNDYIDYPIGKGISVLKFALKLQKIWTTKIKLQYPKYKFCFIVSYDGEFVILRFHKVRKEERLFLTDDLESYLQEGILEVIT